MENIVYSLYFDGLSGVLTLIMGLVLIYMRFRARDAPMTKAQGWGMTLLAWLFICNAVLNIIGLYSFIKPTMILYFTRLDLPIIGPMFLIAFGLVFPQPVVRSSRLPLLFLFLSGVLVIVILMQLGGHASKPLIPGWGDIQNTWMWAGWTIPLLRWITLYRKNRAHPEISLILTLLIWGVLYHIIYALVINPMVDKSAAQITKEIVFSTNIFQLLTIALMALIIHQIFERRGAWGLAEKLHIFMFGLIFVLGLLLFCIEQAKDSVVYPYIAWPVGYLFSEAGILIIRPALIIYAILAYQFFGPELGSEKPVILVTALMLAYFGGVVVSFLFYGMGFDSMGAVGFVTFFVLLAPAAFIAGRIVHKLVPSSRKMSRKEVRDLYFVSMFSAFFKGAIEDKDDDAALATLRKRLGISDREHALMVEGERSRVREESVVNRIGHAIFVKDTGTLVASVGPMGDADETVLASMLTAVRMFVKDAFGGASGDLDTIQYGDKKLLMEWERGYILAIDMEGEYDPTSRVLVGDLLALLMRRHWKILADWDGDLNAVKPVQEHLAQLVINYNKTGAL